MTARRQASLACSRTGRIVLHLAALLAGGGWAWHWAGIMREIAQAARGQA
jgi:hypothetical protein